jgi:hypothetical protein
LGHKALDRQLLLGDDSTTCQCVRTYVPSHSIRRTTVYVTQSRRETHRLGRASDVGLASDLLAGQQEEAKVPIESKQLRIRTVSRDISPRERRFVMQRPLAPFRTIEGAIGLFDDCYNTDGTPAASQRIKHAPCMDGASALGLANVRTAQQLKLIAAIMAHPSYNAACPKVRRRGKADRVERIPSR